MENNLRKELKILAELILDTQNEPDLDSLLNQSRMLYEKCIVLQHLNVEESATNEVLEEPVSIDETPIEPEPLQIFKELKNQTVRE